jgi:hypothetical protein
MGFLPLSILIHKTLYFWCTIMAEKGSLAGIAILSILVGAGLGFGLTWLVQPSGGVLQTQYLSVKSLAAKSDNDLTNTLVPGMQLDVTTKGFSYITVEFSGSLGYHLDGTFVSVARFNITLEVDGVPVAESKAEWYHQAATGQMEEGSLGVTMAWVSGSLPAAPHSVRVTWISLTDATGLNQVYFSTTNHNTTRSITIQEIRSSLF